MGVFFTDKLVDRTQLNIRSFFIERYIISRANPSLPFSYTTTIGLQIIIALGP